jgi:hypothetical protein
MIKVYCKEGVWFKFISYEFLTLARIVCRVYEKYGLVPTVTSAADGIHGIPSLHPDGLGWDWRTWGLKDPRAAAKEIKEEAQAVDYHYDVLYEDNPPHIHSEYDMNKRQ